jgi:hypothetical protein
MGWWITMASPETNQKLESFNECPDCQGNGYVLKKGPHWNGYQRLPCVTCEATGIKKKMWSSRRFLELKILLPKEADTSLERKAQIEERIEELQDEIDDKESEIEDLEDEISSLENQIRRLRS